MILLAAVASLAAAQAAPAAPAAGAGRAPDAATAPRIAPDIPLTDGASPSSARPDEGPLARLGDGAATPSVDSAEWRTIPESTRTLLVMGTTDGFAAAGPKAPCLPGRTAQQIDAALVASGFGDKRPGMLPEGVASLADRKSPCADVPVRDYDGERLRKLSDEDLATYLTGAVRAYTRIAPCQTQSAAALASAAAIFVSGPGDQPVPLLRAAMEEACASQAGSTNAP